MGIMEKLLENAGMNPSALMQQAESLAKTLQAIVDKIAGVEAGQKALNANLGTIYGQNLQIFELLKRIDEKTSAAIADPLPTEKAPAVANPSLAHTSFLNGD